MIYKFENKLPQISKSCFVAQSSDIIGDVCIDEDSSIWFGTVMRGDTNHIRIGKCSNIQDNCTIHANTEGTPTIIEDYVSVGHGVVLHGCTVGSYSMIGMGSIVLDGVEIGQYTLVGAGSLVTSNKKIPDGVLCMGSPAKVIRKLTDEEKRFLKENAKSYVQKSKKYK